MWPDVPSRNTGWRVSNSVSASCLFTATGTDWRLAGPDSEALPCHRQSDGCVAGNRVMRNSFCWLVAIAADGAVLPLSSCRRTGTASRIPENRPGCGVHYKKPADESP